MFFYVIKQTNKNHFLSQDCEHFNKYMRNLTVSKGQHHLTFAITEKLILEHKPSCLELPQENYWSHHEFSSQSSQNVIINDPASTVHGTSTLGLPAVKNRG